MAGFRLGIAVLVAAAGGLATQVGRLGVHPSEPGGGFGGRSHVRIAHVGRIDVDLESARSAGLRRTSCVGASPGTECFVASARH